MEPLNPIPQCIDCLQSLAKNTALMAADDQPGLVEKSESVCLVTNSLTGEKHLTTQIVVDP